MNKIMYDLKITNEVYYIILSICKKTNQRLKICYEK